MKFLECPYCKDQAAHLLELFVFPYPLWLNGMCRKCQERIKIDYGVVAEILFYLALGIAMGWMLGLFIHIESILFTVFLYGLFVSMPLMRGKKLFVKRAD